MAASRTAGGSIRRRSSTRWSVSSSGASAAFQASRSGSSRFHARCCRTRVPSRCRLSTSPLAASTRIASRTEVREAANSPMMALSRGRMLPGGMPPPTMRLPIVSTIRPCSPRAAYPQPSRAASVLMAPPPSILARRALPTRTLPEGDALFHTATVSLRPLPQGGPFALIASLSDEPLPGATAGGRLMPGRPRARKNHT